MKRMVLGVFLAALAMYMWGFLYWGMNPLPYKAWHETPDDERTQAALLQHFPESGTYYVPSVNHEQEKLEELFKRGPIAMIHIHREGRSLYDPMIMVQGFGLYLIVVFVMALLLILADLPSLKARFKFLVLGGLAAVLLIDVGDAVWWGTPLAWKAHTAFYNFTAFVIAGTVLSYFLKQPKKKGA